MSRFNFVSMLKGLIRSTQQNIYTSLPARVITYYPQEQCVDVKPILRQRFDENSGSVEMPVIYKVPVLFPSAGGGILSFPINSETDETESSGDIVMLEFSMRSMDEWLTSTQEGDVIPENNRYHSLTDAVAKPSLYKFGVNLQPHAQHVELKFKDTVISLQDDGTDKSNLTITTEGNTGITINIVKGSLVVNNQEGDTTVNTNGGNTNLITQGTTNIQSQGNVNVTAPLINLN